MWAGTLRRAVGKSSWALAAFVATLAAVSPGAAAGETTVGTVNSDSSYPEGPLIEGSTLYYTEMGNDRLVRFEPETGNKVLWTRPDCGPTSVARYGSGFLVLCHRQAVLAEISPIGETLAIVDRDSAGRQFADPNAAVSDRKGGVYFSSSGTFAPWAPAEGALLYLAADGTLRRLAEDIHYANGVALSPDGRTLYLSEHLERQVLAFDVAGDGTLSGRRVHLRLDDIEPGQAKPGWWVGPDGLAIDTSGNLAIAEYGAGHVLIVSPEKKLLGTVQTPDAYTTGVAFSADGVRLFITASAARTPVFRGSVIAVANPNAR